MGRGHFLESIEGIKDLFIRFHTTAEILAKDSLESNGINILTRLQVPLANQVIKHVLDTLSVIGHALVSSGCQFSGIHIAHVNEAILEGGRTQIGHEYLHTLNRLIK